MRTYEAPAKLNFSLHVFPPEPTGYHPIESLAQTIEWCDLLDVEGAEETSLSVVGADLEPEGNLVSRAFDLVGKRKKVNPSNLTLHKHIPVAAGLGGGSSDAAAALVAAADHGGLDREIVSDLAPDLGADVPMFIVGGTQVMRGFGEVLEARPPLVGFSVAVVVPEFQLATADVYARWDQLDGPVGEATGEAALPPALRDGMPMRNDLLPAALELAWELADFMADVRSIWGTAVALTGSGPACFGFFPDEEEAADAASSVAGCRAAVGVSLRDHGVAELA